MPEPLAERGVEEMRVRSLVRNSKKLNSRSVHTLPIAVRTKTALFKARIATVGQLRTYTALALSKMPWVGSACIEELRRVLAELGVFLVGEEPAPPSRLIVREKVRRDVRVNISGKKWLMDAIARGDMDVEGVASIVAEELRHAIAADVMKD